MKKIIVVLSLTLFTIVSIVLVKPKQSEATIGINLKKLFSEKLSNKKFKYESVVKLANGESKRLEGVLAFDDGGQFYDSSNMRILVMNKEWFLNIDHEDKMVDVLYLPKVERQLKEIGGFDFKDLFLGQMNVEDKDIQFVDEIIHNGHTVMTSVQSDSVLNKFEIELEMNAQKDIVEYSGTADLDLTDHYSQFEETTMREDVDFTAKLTFRCYEIQSLASNEKNSCFDTSRFIDEKRGEAKLKKFTSYQMLMP